jgi:hypothetical protein
MRPKIKNIKIVSLSLDESEVEMMDLGTSTNGFRSNSDYIGWLIRNHNMSTNPAKYLKELDREEQIINEKLDELKHKRKLLETWK